MKSSKNLLQSLSQTALLTQEETLEKIPKKGHLSIGIPKEVSFQENRIALVPESVALLVNNGHHVIVESNAGKISNFQDHDYSEAGAQIAFSPEEVYKNSDLILKVAPPTAEEIEFLKPKQTLISALQLTTQPESFLKNLMAKKITAIAYDFLQDEEGIFSIIRSMSEIAGNASVLIAAEYLSNVNNGQGAMLGGISGIPPSEVIIIGAGTVGEFAARAAHGLGATVKVFDNSVYKLRRIQSLIGSRIFTCIIQPNLLAKHLKSADVVIGAIRSKEGRTPLVVTENMVSEMKVGSVIVDVSIDQGGCFETSKPTNHTNPVFRKHGVTHYCVPNIASRVSKTASYALSTIFAPILLNVGEEGGIDKVLKYNKGVRNGVYIFNGSLTNKNLGEMYHLKYKDLDLLVAGL